MTTIRIRTIIIAIGILLLFSFLFVIGLGDQGALDLYRLRLKKDSLNRSTLEQEKKNRDLYHVIQRLKHDPEFVEHIARRELGMVGKDEVVYQFTGEKQRKTLDDDD
ncbi:MAG: hypothetical protein BA872_01230 [Desulfobacterales bacterium C00003060]|nr:MAG: hypothetical protein BA861_01640 [Desulfobacterales bacterium S3730MH5]OEU80133.1 MAG: hypothetical protein BA872_01230 [Desulfobacterales bacterium C00003060]OEU80232.1 MAG: hypothetical protein BA865_02715 [Desulfobacterales bacterium S5133MH4]